MANRICSSFTIIIMFMSLSVSSARPLMKNTIAASSLLSTSLVNRLKLDEDSAPTFCWDSLIQLQHCTGEVVTFFMNGEMSIGHGCCHAIETVGRKCWPAVFGALGFTASESDVLQGYCAEQDSDKDGDGISSPPPPTSLVSKSENSVMNSAP